MHHLTMTLLSGPGFPLGDETRKIRIDLGLDRVGNPDPDAWHSDPAPWRAELEGQDIAQRRGDIQYDPDFGWYLRMPPKGENPDDATSWAIDFTNAPARPGETVITRGPGGEDWVWRIVQVEVAQETQPAG